MYKSDLTGPYAIELSWNDLLSVMFLISPEVGRIIILFCCKAMVRIGRSHIKNLFVSKMLGSSIRTLNSLWSHVGQLLQIGS